MKTHTFQRTVTLNDEEFAMLTKIGSVGYLFNFDGPPEQLDACDGLRDRGLIMEDGDGRCSITMSGREFLNKAVTV